MPGFFVASRIDARCSQQPPPPDIQDISAPNRLGFSHHVNRRDRHFLEKTWAWFHEAVGPVQSSHVPSVGSEPEPWKGPRCVGRHFFRFHPRKKPHVPANVAAVRVLRRPSRRPQHQAKDDGIWTVCSYRPIVTIERNTAVDGQVSQPKC